VLTIDFQRLRDRLTDPLLTALTIMFAALLFVVAPLQTMGLISAHNFGLGFSLVIIATVLVISDNWLPIVSLLGALGLVIMATVLRLKQPSPLDILLDASAWLIVGVTLSIVTARAVFAVGKITYHRIVGAILLYLTIGLVFVALFCFVALYEPNAFSGLGPLRDNLSVSGNFIYFSFVTLTTVGYGDIAPVHPMARALANVESIIGQLYPATLLARLVTLETENNRVK